MRENLVITWPPVRLYVRPATAYKPMSNVILSTTTLTWITEKELEREKKGDEFRWKKNMYPIPSPVHKEWVLYIL